MSDTKEFKVVTNDHTVHKVKAMSYEITAFGEYPYANFYMRQKGPTQLMETILVASIRNPFSVTSNTAENG